MKNKQVNQPSTRLSSNNNNKKQIPKTGVTMSKDKLSQQQKYFSNNNTTQTSQLIDISSSRRISTNPSPGSSIILNGVSNNQSMKMTRNKIANSYAAKHQGKVNNIKINKDESMNISRRLSTNCNVINLQQNDKIIEEIDEHSECLPKTIGCDANEQNCNLLGKENKINIENDLNKKTSNNARISFAKPPLAIKNSNKYIPSKINENNLYNDPNNKNINSSKNISIDLNLQNYEDSNNYKIIESNSGIIQDHKEHIPNEENLNFLKEDNYKDSASELMNNNKNIENDISFNNGNNYINENTRIINKNMPSMNNIKPSNKNNVPNLYKNYSEQKITGIIAKVKEEQYKKNLNDSGFSKTKKSIYDAIKNSSKKVNSTSFDSKLNSSKNNINQNKSNNNLKLNKNNSINGNNKKNNNKIILTNAKLNVSKDKENSSSISNIKEVSENIESTKDNNPLILKNKTLASEAFNKNLNASSPYKKESPENVIKNNLNSKPEKSLNEYLIKSRNEEEEENFSKNKSIENTTENFNKYRNAKKHGVNPEINSSEVNLFAHNSNEKNINLKEVNENKQQFPQEEKYVYSNTNKDIEKINVYENIEDQELEKKENLDFYIKSNFEKKKIEISNTDQDLNSLNSPLYTVNKINFQRNNSNNFSKNPLTSIEEIDEKNNLQLLEDSLKSSKNTKTLLNKENNKEFRKLGVESSINSNEFNIYKRKYEKNLTKDDEENVNIRENLIEIQIKTKDLGINDNNPSDINNNVPLYYDLSKKENLNNELNEEYKNGIPLNIQENNYNNIRAEEKEKEKHNFPKVFNYNAEINNNKDFIPIQDLMKNLSPINNSVNEDKVNSIVKYNTENSNKNPINGSNLSNDIYIRGKVN